MPLTSDVTINFSRFADSSITPKQHAFNAVLRKSTQTVPRWYDIGAEKYREMRRKGETPLPARTVLEGGKDIQIQSRDPNRDIPCRVWLPPSGTKPIGTFMHIHGGGWVLNSQLDFDPYCKRMAEDTNLAVVSVGYRLAPEHIFPAATEDVYDAAEWLAKNAEHHFGGPLLFVSGESSGGHLTMLAVLHLLSLPQPYLGLKGVIPHFAVFDLSALPSLANFKEDLVLPKDIMYRYLDVFVPQHLADPLRRSSCPLCGAIDADAIGSGSPYRTGAWCLPLGIREDAIQQEDIRSVGSWIAEPEPGRKTGN